MAGRSLTDDQRELVGRNVGLVWGWWAAVGHKFAGRRVNSREVRAEAVLCLCQAATTHNPARGRFSTYAYRAMTWGVLKMIAARKWRGRDRTITLEADVPTGAESGGETTDWPVGATDNWPAEATDFLDGLSGLDPDPAERSGRDAAEHVRRLFRFLHPIHRTVLEMRFGMNGNDPHTLDEVGEKLGLTRERVRSLEALAFWKLRQADRRLPGKERW